MICPDCGKELVPPRQHTISFTSSYYCAPCRNDHIVWEGVKVDDYVVQTRDWRFYCETASNKSRIQRMYMDIESDTSICYRWYTVLELPVIPENLSVETIEEKLKMYLLFS